MNPRHHIIATAALALLALSACDATPKPIFAPINPPIVWPPPPDQPRLRYIGELTGQANVRNRPKGLEALRAVIAGPKPTFAFSTPMAVAVADERVYVADGQVGVHILDLSTRSYSLINRAAGDLLQWPIDVIVLGQNTIAVADSRRKAVFLFTSNGQYVQTIGAGVLQRPAALAWSASAGELYVLDAAAHSIVVFDRGGAMLRRIGGRGSELGNFNFPAGLTHCGDAGVVVADSMNFRIQVLNSNGAVSSAFGQRGDAAGCFALPRDVACDSQGHLYVLDNQFENVQVFDQAGELLMALGQEGHAPGEFYLPSGITIDAKDRVWIADTYNRRVQVFQYLPETAE